MSGIWESISNFITAENIALFSVVITVLIFVFSRRSELRYKKHDDKKAQYLKLISLLEQLYFEMDKSKNIHKNNTKKNNSVSGELEISKELKKQYFDVGASLLLYGSKKMYRQYLLFREFSINPLIIQCKYYREDIGIYILADILTTIRKEVGLSLFDSIHANEALGFFINDVTNNPIAKGKAIDAKFRIRMIKLELAVINQYKSITLKKMFYVILKPIFCGLLIILKYLVVIPFGRLFAKMFPHLVEKTKNNDTSE